MYGGGIYGKMCSLSGSEEENRKQMKHAYQNDDPYSVDKHRDFRNVLSKYKQSVKDIREHHDYPALVQKIRSETGNIKEHPQYPALMEKYAVRDTTTCPPTYKSCPKPGTYLLKTDIAKGYVSRKDEGIAQLAKYKKKYQDLASDIKTHPSYPALMKKFAFVDNSTCPPTFKSCMQVIEEEKRKHKKKREKLVKKIANGTNASASASASSGESESVITGSETIYVDAKCRKAVTDFIKAHPELKDIKKHPQYKSLMEKVGCLDKSVCPPTYKKCKPKCPVIPIQDHPDIHKYILKTHIPKLQLQLQTRASANQSQSESESESKHLAAQNALLKEKIQVLKQKIKEHKKSAKDAIKKYAWKDTSTCPPTYKTCEAPKKISDFNITDHPDIHKYILKSQLPKILDRECRKHFKH